MSSLSAENGAPESVMNDAAETKVEVKATQTAAEGAGKESEPAAETSEAAKTAVETLNGVSNPDVAEDDVTGNSADVAESGENDDDVWLFGYGSLIWKPDIEFEEQKDVFVTGYSRRFWQGSPEHRGTEEAPGLVVTLLTPEEHTKVQDDHGVHQDHRDAPDVRVWGRIFRVKGHIMRATMAALEHREKAGYAKEFVDTVDTSGVKREALVFRATPDNEHFFGPRPEHVIAKHIESSEGESGHNLEYFMRMFEALDEVQKVFPEHEDIVDSHLRNIHAHISTPPPTAP